MRAFDFPNDFRYQTGMRSLLNSILRLFLGISSLPCGTVLAADAPATFKVTEFTFTRPKSWEWVEVDSPMRKAQLRIVDEKTKSSADVIFFHFGAGQGGDTKQNLTRWFGQFQEPPDQIKAKTEEITVRTKKVTYAQAQGTYLSGMPGAAKTPMKDHALIGAIIESEQGNVYIRVTGPAALVQRSTVEFKTMVEAALKAP
jgi:hypothetical protein